MTKTKNKLETGVLLHKSSIFQEKNKKRDNVMQSF